MADSAEKTREIRLRRTADRRGFRLERCRRRDPHALGYGRYRLRAHGRDDLTTTYDLTLDDVETALGLAIICLNAAAVTSLDISALPS